MMGHKSSPHGLALGHVIMRIQGSRAIGGEKSEKLREKVRMENNEKEGHMNRETLLNWQRPF
jgi:hypothetical protein